MFVQTNLNFQYRGPKGRHSVGPAVSPGWTNDGNERRRRGTQESALCRTFGARSVFLFLVPALRPGLRTTASSRLVWKSLGVLYSDRPSMQTRREAPEVRSHARERVVTDYAKNRGPKGRCTGTE